MKNIAFLAFISTLTLSACTSIQNNESAQPNIGIANPASKFCVENRGKLEIVKESKGEVAYCQLENGEKIEEWTFFRQNQPQCLAEEAAKLVGQSNNLTDDQIKQATKSEYIRRVEPNQAVTMDYRVDRVTITIDPQTKKIIQATCG